MRSGSTTLAAVLQGSFDWSYVADVYLDGNRLVANVPLTGVSFSDSATSLVQYTGSAKIVYQGPFAKTIAPARIGDALSPYGSQLWVYVVVTAGDFSERIPLGRYLITETPTIKSTPWWFNGAVLTAGDVIDVTLKDLLSGVQRDTFDVPGTPPSLSSVWAEVRRLSQLPITVSIADAAISTTIAYQSDKLQALYDLATTLDAVIAVTSDGTVSMRPNVWPAPVATIKGGNGGTLLDVGRAMSNDNVYNRIVVLDNASDGSGILASLEVTSGPLRAANSDGSLSPYRRVPYYYSSPYITTAQQAAAYCAANLPRVSQLHAITLPIVEVFNPLRDLGDVVTVQRYASGQLAQTLTGRVIGIDRDGSGQQTTTLQVNP